MQKFVYTFFVAAAFTLGCVVGRCEITNAPLKFYIVSEQKIEGGKFIDTPSLPKVGYISALPDLVVTNLLDVYREKQATSAIVDGKIVPFQPLEMEKGEELQWVIKDRNTFEIRRVEGIRRAKGGRP